MDASPSSLSHLHKTKRRGKPNERAGFGEMVRQATNAANSLSGLYVSGELLSLGLSCEHQPEPTPLACSSQNPGAWAVGKEVVRAVTGVTLVRDASEAHDGAGNALIVGGRVVHEVHGLGVVSRANGSQLQIHFDSWTARCNTSGVFIASW